MPYITGAVLAAGAIYGVIDASNRRKKAQKAIDALKKSQPKFRSAEDIQNEAERRITSGYSPSEVANFQQSLNRRSNAAYRLATDRNPNLSGAINAGINYGNIGARLQFAASDAQLRRQRQNDYVSRITGQSNAQTSADIMNKRDQEIAYGNAKNQANADIYNSLMMLGYAGSTAAGGRKQKPQDVVDVTGTPQTNFYGQSAPPESTVNTADYTSPYGTYDPYGNLGVPPSQRFPDYNTSTR